jgi:hypothetical protein
MAVDIFELKDGMKRVVSDTPETFEDLDQGNG